MKTTTSLAFALPLLFAACASTASLKETRINVAVRDGTELYGLSEVPVHLHCQNDVDESKKTDQHGNVQFTVQLRQPCTLSARWREETFSHPFTVEKPKLHFMLVSRFALLLHGVSFEPKLRAERVYPEGARP